MHTEALCARLGLTTAELNSLYAVEPTINDRGGDPSPSGNGTAADLRARFGLPAGEDLIDALEAHGVVTAAEAAWLREA